MNDPLEQKLADLFDETGKAHHKAFIKTDGADPDWPIWYAEYLGEKLGRYLDATFVKSELIYLLVEASKEQAHVAPGGDWASYYARFFIDRYL